MADRPLNMTTRYFIFPDDIIPVGTVSGVVMGGGEEWLVMGGGEEWCGDGRRGGVVW